MKWAWRLGQIAGIALYVHATFVILIAWVALAHWTQRRNVLDAMTGVAFILALFGCVVLHELGHALTARRYGIRTRDITLLPIGGVARLEQMPEEPLQEFWVAIAGPAVNVVIAALLFAFVLAMGRFEPVSRITLTQGPFLERLMVLNVILVVFNLLPAFPMDGGRIVRALLATRMEYTRATQIAATLGQGMALLFGFVGFFTNPFLLFIALFVWIGAAAEASMVQVRAALSGIPVRRAMITEFRTLGPRDSLRRAAEALLAGSQQDFPVVDGSGVVGVLLRVDLIAALAAQRHEASVGEVMRREFTMVDSHEMLDRAFARVQRSQVHTAPVTHDGRLVGLITMDNIGEFVAVQGALEAVEG